MLVTKDTSKSLENLMNVYLCTVAKGRVVLGRRRSYWVHVVHVGNIRLYRLLKGVKNFSLHVDDKEKVSWTIPNIQKE